MYHPHLTTSSSFPSCHQTLLWSFLWNARVLFEYDQSIGIYGVVQVSKYFPLYVFQSNISQYIEGHTNYVEVGKRIKEVQTDYLVEYLHV